MSNSEFPGASWQEPGYGRQSARGRGSRAARRGGGGQDGWYGGNPGNGRNGDVYGGNGYGGNGHDTAGRGMQSGVGPDGDIGRGLGYRGGRGRAARGRRGVRGRGAVGSAFQPAPPSAPYPGGYGQPGGVGQDWTSGLYRDPQAELPTPSLRQRVGTTIRSPRGYVLPRGYASPPGPRQRPPGNLGRRIWRGSWWRRWTLKKASGVLAGATALVVLIGVGGFFYAYSSVQLPPVAELVSANQSSTVYFAGPHGQPVGCFCVQNRTILSTMQIFQDPYLREAFFAAEDRSFMTEPGISITGAVRALLVDLSGGGTQGGSTITEQLIKQYLDPAGVGLTAKEKLKEFILAVKLSKVESKRWILTGYLNAINLGNNAYGVEAAAKTYWGIDAWQVNPAQAAMLAAMVQQPSGFDPEHPAQNAPALPYSLLDRWIYVLGNMVRDGAISQQQYNTLVPDAPQANSNAWVQPDLKHFPTVHITLPTWTGWRGYIMTLVESELSAYYGISLPQLNQNGYQIHTTINPRLMTELYAAIQYDKRLMRQYAAQQGKIPFQRWMRLGAVLEQPGTGAIEAFYAGPGWGVKHCKQVDCQFNTILDPQQVGSSFKPYVLTTAISQGMNAQTSILNSHQTLCIPPADWPGQQGIIYQHMKSKWSLANCNTHIGFYQLNQPGEINHPLPVPLATAYSSNPAFEDLIHRTGVFPVLDMAAKLGVSKSSVDYLKSLFGPGAPQAGSVQAALGQGPLTAVDQANTFATLVSNGVTALPHIISYVTQNGSTLPRPAVYKSQHNLKPYVAADADYALSFDTRLAGATGTNANIGRPTVAKTGTLGRLANSSEAWFIGAIPQYSFAVALFTKTPAHQVLNNLPYVGSWAGEYGGAWPATIWHTYMSKITANLPVKPLPTPNFNPPQFTKWNQAPKIPPKCPKQQGGGSGGGQGGGPGGGGGNGNGHGHHHGMPVALLAKPKPGKQKCNGGGPSPSPSPSPTGSPSPNPSRSISPSPSPSFTFPAVPGQSAPAAPSRHRPAPQPKSAVPGLTAAAVLPEPALPRLVPTARVTGLL